MKKNILIFFLLVLSCILCACESSDYKQANTFFEAGKYEEALDLYQKMGDYKDAIELSNECQYRIAHELLNRGEYDKAEQLFGELSTYKESENYQKECIYQEALSFIEKKLYKVALRNLDSILGYKDTDSLILLVNNWLTYEEGHKLIRLEKYTDAYDLFNQIQGFQDVDTILSCFTKIRILKAENCVIYDNLENRISAGIKYEYNGKGQLVSAEAINAARLFHFSKQIQAFANEPYSVSNAMRERYTYNEDGTISTITGTTSSTKSYVIVYNYDENGNIEYEHATTNTDTGICYYIYDEKGQLTGVRLDRNSTPNMRYSYDTSGKLIKAESNVFGNMFTMDYFYDGDILVSKEVRRYSEKYLTEHYTYNDDGTLQKIEYEYADSRNGRVEITFHYGDYIIYHSP